MAISVAEACATVLSRAQRLDAVERPLQEVLDCVLAQDVCSPLGNSIREPSQALRPIPQGDVAEDQVEDTDTACNGQTVLEAGHRITAWDMGLLPSMGVTQLQIYPLPRVALLSTGDELVDPFTASAPRSGMIRDSNKAMLAAACAELGCRVLDLGIARDRPEAVTQALHTAIASDAHILVTTGGVSMGDRDYVKPFLRQLGQVHFERVLLKPGKPMTFASIERKAEGGVPRSSMLVFGLPGNPVSSLVCFYIFVLPAIRQMAGWLHPHLSRVQATTLHPIKLDPQRPEYHRAVIRWNACSVPSAVGFTAESTGAQASSRLLSMKGANALLDLPQSDGILPAGSLVSALLLSDLSKVPPPADFSAPETPHQTTSVELRNPGVGGMGDLFRPSVIGGFV